MFCFGVGAQILVFGAIGFGQPTLALHLASYEGFTKFWVGFYFAMPCIAYILNTIMVSKYCEYMPRKSIIFIGLALLSMSLYLIGTSPMLGIKDTKQTIFGGLMLLGFSAAMITIPLLPEVLYAIEQKFPNLAGEELNNVISGYFNSCMGIGEAVGPITAGMLVEIYGFRNSNDLIASTILTFTLLFFIVNGNLSLLVPLTVKNTREDQYDDHYMKYKEVESAGPTASTLETEQDAPLHTTLRS